MILRSKRRAERDWAKRSTQAWKAFRRVQAVAQARFEATVKAATELCELTCQTAENPQTKHSTNRPKPDAHRVRPLAPLGAAATCLRPSFLISVNTALDGPIPLRTTSPALAHHFLPEIEERLAPIGPEDDDRVGETDHGSTTGS